MKRGGQRKKGHDFERKIATALREVFEPELATRMQQATAKERPNLLKASRVRRGEQGKGASDPDVGVEGLPVWFECQDAIKVDVLDKLAQAERDVLQHQTSEMLAPMVVFHEKGRRTIRAATRLCYLLSLFGDSPDLEDLVVEFSFDDLRDLLREREVQAF